MSVSIRLPGAEARHIARRAADRALQYMPAEMRQQVMVQPVSGDGYIGLRVVGRQPEQPARNMVVRGADGRARYTGSGPRTHPVRDESGRMVTAQPASFLESESYLGRALAEVVNEWLDDMDESDWSRIFDSDRDVRALMQWLEGMSG